MFVAWNVWCADATWAAVGGERCRSKLHPTDSSGLRSCIARRCLLHGSVYGVTRVLTLNSIGLVWFMMLALGRSGPDFTFESLIALVARVLAVWKYMLCNQVTHGQCSTQSSSSYNENRRKRNVIWLAVKVDDAVPCMHSSGVFSYLYDQLLWSICCELQRTLSYIDHNQSVLIVDSA